MNNALSSDYDRGFERGVVTFIDILGYKALLQTRHADDIVKVLKALRRFTEGDGNKEESPRRIDEARLYTQSYSESVSDAVVRVRTVDTQSQDGPLGHELFDLTLAMIECINGGFLIRGGLTIGPVHVGLDGRGPIFGNAMVRAYEIEENEAIYPRIMIDDDAIDAYLGDQTLWQDGEIDGYEAEHVARYVGVAEDGSHFLDYLRAADSGVFDDGEAGRFAFLQRHREIIVSGLEDADAKARRKLIWLGKYHNHFVTELRRNYDMSDPAAEFETEIGIAPDKLFDALLINDAWTDFPARLAEISGRA